MCDDEQAVRLALAHEWTHIERATSARGSVAGLARVLFFYQPLVWWLRRQLRLCQDYVADAGRAARRPSPRIMPSFSPFGPPPGRCIRRWSVSAWVLVRANQNCTGGCHARTESTAGKPPAAALDRFGDVCRTALDSCRSSTDDFSPRKPRVRAPMRVPLALPVHRRHASYRRNTCNQQAGQGLPQEADLSAGIGDGGIVPKVGLRGPDGSS